MFDTNIANADFVNTTLPVLGTTLIGGSRALQGEQKQNLNGNSIKCTKILS